MEGFILPVVSRDLWGFSPLDFKVERFRVYPSKRSIGLM